MIPFFKKIQIIIQCSFKHCPIIIMEDLKLLDFMKEFELKSQIREIQQKSNFNHHVWVNVPLNE
jgi:hypothetical protein